MLQVGFVIYNMKPACILFLFIKAFENLITKSNKITIK